MIEKDNMVINEKPLKIIIEANPDIANYETPFLLLSMANTLKT